ncbi:MULTISPECIES: hypothetical protein [Haloferax]|uniref:Uncharacterized protein n=1 Tax=Haloferax marinum TaxID=2666143 RepID=A0A6A8G7Y3_9EURY|nr:MULTISPECIES: hypothetical protein [Haloferax]KAB1198112.1 hypothetical protein Hfx1150_11495 [Haloferax sp. CBA1150]MRW97184.1 hypothetical protein [Haloferax marinum]
MDLPTKKEMTYIAVIALIFSLNSLSSGFAVALGSFVGTVVFLSVLAIVVKTTLDLFAKRIGQ